MSERNDRLDLDLQVLQMIATGTPLPVVLEALVRLVESQAHGMVGSILLLENGHLRHGAAPNLPADWVASIDGLAIGPDRGSCGTAAFSGEVVITEDVETDPKWDDFREGARKAGLRSCWSVPIFGADRSVLGTFAMYGAEPRRPEPGFVERLEAATHLGAIAIERHRREQAVRASEQRARMIVENALDANVTMDPHGLVTGWTPRAREVFGWTAEEALGQPLSQLIIPAGQRQRHEQGLLRYIQTGVGPILGQRLEMTAQHRDGGVFPVELTVAAVEVDGQLMFSAFCRDITERRLAEQALRDSEEHLSLVYDHVDDVIFQLQVEPGGHYRFVSINPAFTATTGLAPAQVIGKRVDEVIPEPSLSFVRERYAEAIRTRRVVRWEETTTYPTGVKRGDVSITPVFGPEGQPRFLIGSVHDRTERTRLEDEVRQLQKMEAIGRLSGGVAHDFNNILSVILMTAELLLEPSFDDEPGRHLEQIVKAAERGAGLTRQFLAFSRKQVLRPEVLDLQAVLANVEPMLRRLLGEEVELVLEPGAELGRVLADPGQIEQVVVNLVINARDAMPGGGRITIATANVRLDEEFANARVQVEPGDYVMLAVTDSGTGMSDEVRQRIFEPFFTTKESGKGTGLGLSTVYGIVRQSGGVIEVESRLGAGSTFRVWLPRSTGEVATRPARVVPATPPRTVGHALVVEDDPAVRTTLARVLHQLRCTVTVASTAEEALGLVEQHGVQPDLLITDSVMPGMGGVALASRLRTIRPDLRVLYVSGYPDVAATRDALSPSSAFLQKPFSIADLVVAFEELSSRP